MKIESRKIISTLIVIIMLLTIFIPNIALAIDGQPELKVSVSKTNLQRGDEFTVTVGFVDNGSTECTGFDFKLNFNANVLEYVSLTPGELTGMSQINTDNATNGVITFVMANSTAYTSRTLYTVTFKVKPNAVGGSSALNITPNNSSYPIESETGGINTTITNTNVKINVPANNIALNGNSFDIYEGQTQKLDVTFTPTDTTDTNITWTSSDTSIATVASDGTVTAVSRGKTTITATTEGGLTTSCEINVKREIGSIVLNKSSIGLDKGETEQLTATLPADSDGDKTITWTSSDTSIATVASDGTVTAVNKGTAIITATTSNGKKATCAVSVGVSLKNLSFEGNITEKTLKLGIENEESFDLSVVYDPVDTDVDKTVLKWDSTDTSVVSVENGKVTARGSGDAKVTASIAGKTATCDVHVRIPILSISMKNKTELTYGEEEKLEVTYTTYNNMQTTDDKTIKWTTSDKNVIDISTDGTLITNGAGTATITATSVANEKLTASCEVTVKPAPLESIVIEQQSIVVEKGDTTKLTVKYNPDKTTDSKDLTWESEDSNIAVVDATGVVTALKNGTVKITATTKTGLTATTTIKVVTTLKDIKLSETDVTINKDVPLTLKVTLDPIDATLEDDTVKWSSSNTAVATVNENGDVVTHKAGTAFIYVTVGGITKECKITVNVPLKNITMENKITLLKGQKKTLTVVKDPEGTNFSGKITFDSSDTKKATVDKEGKIEGLSATETDKPITITANAIENDVIIASATCEVTVIEIPLESIAIDHTDFSLGIGRTQKLNVLYNPEQTTDDKTVTWMSSNTEVASVDSTGLVTAKSAGEAVIVASVNGKYAEVTITTYEIPITAIKVYTNLSNNKLAVGKAITLTVKVEPEDATRQGNYKFTSSDESILTVDEKGNVIAHKVGKTLITVETENGIKEQVEIEVVRDSASVAEEYKRLSPKTEDIKIELYTIIMIVSALGISIILMVGRKKK